MSDGRTSTPDVAPASIGGAPVPDAPMPDRTVVEVVDAALDRAVGGTAAVVHLHGPVGSGRSAAVEWAAARATARGMAVVHLHGDERTREVLFDGVGAALRRLTALGDANVDDGDAALLTGVVRGAPPPDGTALRAATLRLLTSVGRPLLFVIDDLHLVDPASAELLRFVVARLDADAVAVLTTGLDAHDGPGAPAARRSACSSVAVPPLPFERLVGVLVTAGVAPDAARRIADLSGGRPGLALAVAAGLDVDVRQGARPLATDTRPVGAVVDAVERRLRIGGVAVERALVVAALDRSGEAGVVQRALALLGEDANGLVRAEELGWVRRVDGRLVIDDPWVRAVAAHLVAAPSRRAAHRALATALDRPDDAVARALHLADGAEELDDGIAGTLDRVAEHVARRGSPAAAARLAERAATIAATVPVRRSSTMRALGWWLDTADVDGVRRVRSTLQDLVVRGDHDPLVSAAIDEATWFVDGVRTGPAASGGVESGGAGSGTAGDDPWSERRRRREAIESAFDTGTHGRIGRGDPAGLLAGLDPASRSFHLARAHRLAGELRDARAEAYHAAALWSGSDHADARRLQLLIAEVELLHDRVADATASIERAVGVPRSGLAAAQGFATEIDDLARRLRGRCTLVARPDMPPAEVMDAWLVAHVGRRGEVEQLIRSAVLAADAVAMEAAADVADRHGLPVEAAEARLVAAGWTAGAERRALAARAEQQLARCGVRCWDARLAALAPVSEAVPAAAAAPDPGLERLTPAELRVAEAVGAGSTNRDVAAQLFLSVKTVDFHLQQIYRKLGVRSRTELAVRLARPPAALPARGGRT
jgi:DNA-binding CsgD family transcriptional regulator